MEAIMPILAFFAASSNLFFIVAILAMFVRMYAASKGNLRLLRIGSWAMLIASAPLALVYSLVAILVPGQIMALLMAALWIWNTWSAYQGIRRR
jgi:hypothetical protein